MSDFRDNKVTRKVRMYPGHSPGYPHIPTKNAGFAGEETSSIQVDSEAIVEERSARPPLPPRTPAITPVAQSQAIKRKLPSARTDDGEVPKAGILRPPRIRRR